MIFLSYGIFRMDTCALPFRKGESHVKQFELTTLCARFASF
jgi:hypothetical protein